MLSEKTKIEIRTWLFEFGGRLVKTGLPNIMKSIECLVEKLDQDEFQEVIEFLEKVDKEYDRAFERTLAERPPSPEEAIKIKIWLGHLRS